MRDLRNRVVVVTGAASGIGRSLAEQLAAEGCKLALSDIDGSKVVELGETLRAQGTEVIADRLDVADREAVHAYAERVGAHFGQVHVLINNAGVALVSTVEETSYEDFEWLMGINFWGVVHGTKAFLPLLKQADAGHIVNVSSIFGIIGVPTQSVYNAAKFAVRGFTESLRMELEMGGSSVSCTSVHPGGIRTNIARAARRSPGADALVGGVGDPIEAFEKAASTTPEKAAAEIIAGIKRNARRVLIGRDAMVIDGMQRFLPTAYQQLMVAGQNRLRQLRKRRS